MKTRHESLVSIKILWTINLQEMVTTRFDVTLRTSSFISQWIARRYFPRTNLILGHSVKWKFLRNTSERDRVKKEQQIINKQTSQSTTSRGLKCLDVAPNYNPHVCYVVMYTFLFFSHLFHLVIYFTIYFWRRTPLLCMSANV